MAATFYLKGDSLTPFKYGTFDAANMPGENGTNSIDVDGTAISGSNINLDQGASGFHSLAYPGFNNLPSGAAVSVVMRVKFGTTGASRALWNIQGYTTRKYNLNEMFINSGNTAAFYATNQAAATVTAGLSGASGVGTTAWHDIAFTWDGSTDANKLQLWVDGSTIAQGTASAAQTSHLRGMMPHIFIGATPHTFSVLTTQMKVDEFAIFDTEIDPSGDGLDGSTRTDSLETIYSISQTAASSGGGSSAISAGEIYIG